MIDQHIKASTCRITCGDESGTGWLIAKDCVITARHCVLAHLESGKPIELFFQDKGGVAVPGKVIGQSEENDACLLSLETGAAEPLPASLQRPREGEVWQTFGYPSSKIALGHRLAGTVAQVLDTPKLKVDLDLSIDPSVALQTYKGMSGAVVVCQGAAVGMIRLKVDGTIAALSLHQLKSFLDENGVASPSELPSPPAVHLADRGNFAETFASGVLARAGRYLFLEGAHGYGKSTFCANFPNDEKAIINLGAYRLSEPNSALGASYRAQPQIFFDWLATAISGLITGRPPRKEDKGYASQIQETAQYLEVFSQYCAKTDRQGLLFIDGLNEIPAGPLLGELIGLLPSKLPPRVTVVLVAPNFPNIAGVLGGRVKSTDVVALPALPDEACYRYCQRMLKPERKFPALVDRICQKAKGHPLYLRYLIEYANQQTADDALNDFPVLTGSIEEYYAGVWTKLLPDEAAANLLALMARLRWGVPLVDFAKALNPYEQAQFVSVISRIRHLLANDESTEIYHASFAAFVIERTTEIDELAYRRLAEFCKKESKVRYCALNRIFHLLRARDHSVFADCNQDWINSAVTLGVEPDALVADVDAVVKRATIEASADEFFRLTLLMQRISFRYDTLFAQSGRLIAEALIALGRPQEALQHVLRLKTIIVSPFEALEVGFLLHQHGYDEEAWMLLERVQQRIIESYGDEMELRQVIQLCSLHIQTLFQMRLADDGSGMKQVMSVMNMAQRACKETLKDDPSKIDLYLRPVIAESAAYFLSFRDVYTEIAMLKTHVANVPPRFLPTLCTALLKFESAVDNYHLPKDRNALAQVFADLAELVPTAELETPLISAVIDTLVRFGAPSKVVELFGTKGGKQPPRKLQLKANNGVDVNHSDLQECLCFWRVAAFLDSEFSCPASGIFLSAGWLDALERLIGALYWCDGRARRAKVDGDQTARLDCREQLKSQVFDQLRFTLQKRASWHDSYAIPENTLPAVYGQLAELLNDCFPEELPEWLDNLVADADGQWGMYSEGFREAAFQVMFQLTREKPSDDIAPRLFRLLQVWRDHVLRGVENRHELVPEILRMIPFFTDLEAKEEAEKLYQHLLSVSMGPTWYKEDQLDLMTDVLRNVSVDTDIQPHLPEIAGYLERADGEMTFQRYVRAEKTSLLGEIARRGKYRAAIAYFRRQCCGLTTELWAEAQQGAIDKLGPLRGNRFPGGALDDQAGVLALVRNSSAAPWALRWALLEIFHCGDSRHLTDYAEAFAEIANVAGAPPELVRRAAIVADVETPADDRLSFLRAFRKALKPELQPAFAAILANAPPPQSTKSTETVGGAKTEDTDDDAGMFLPGVFGRRKALRDATKELDEAERQMKLGNRQAAKKLAVKMLKIAQDGGWSIWGNLSKETQRAEVMLVEGETSAAKVICYYAPLLEGEHHVPKWIPAEHLIGKVGPLLNTTESHRLLDAVIDHVRLMVGDAAHDIDDFNFLADNAPEQSPTVEFIRFIVWLCNHPQGLRRDRAAAMLLWLVEQFPELLPVTSGLAFSMEEGYGPDVLCGVLDGASFREPVTVWNRIAGALELTKVAQELRHVSRVAVLLRLATRAEKAGSVTAKAAVEQIQASLAEHGGAGHDSMILPLWASCLAREWGRLDELVTTDAMANWTAELARLCAPLSITDARALEQAVSTSFRENREGPLDRWESKVRHALNLALWPHVSFENLGDIEAILRIYNPSQPERTVQGVSNPISDQLLAAINAGDYASVLGSNTTVLLNHHDMVVKPAEDGASHLEVLCLLQPASKKKAFFAPTTTQSFCSSELPMPLMEPTPVETCCRLQPELVFLGNFTPAIPLPVFQMLVGAKDENFIRQNWRYSRRNTMRGFGQPEREGCSLSVPRKALTIPAGFKLAWIVWLNGKITAFVDEHNNSMI